MCIVIKIENCMKMEFFIFFSCYRTTALLGFSLLCWVSVVCKGMLTYHRKQYDIENFIEIWTLTTDSFETYVSLLHVDKFLDIGMDRLVEIISPDNIHVWSTLVTYNPPEEGILFNNDSIFINKNSLYQLTFSIGNMDKLNWLMDNIFTNSSSNRENLLCDDHNNAGIDADGVKEMTQIFSKFSELFLNKVRGHGVEVLQQKFLQLWTTLIELGITKHQWIKNFTNDLIFLPYDESYRIFEKYKEKLEAIRGNLELMKILMYIYSKAYITEDDATRKKLDLIHIVKYKSPDANPFYAVTKKHLTKLKFSRNKKQSEYEISCRKVEASKMLTEFKDNMDLPDFDKLLKFGDDSSLSVSNAGELFDKFFTSVTNHSLFFLEIANRELSNISCDTYAVLGIE